jgi:hypothetical protein
LGAEEKGEGGGVAGKKRSAAARALIARALGLRGRATILGVRAVGGPRGVNRGARVEGRGAGARRGTGAGGVGAPLSTPERWRRRLRSSCSLGFR